VICSYSGFQPSSVKPLPIIAMNSTPITVRQIAPSPPRIDVPPTTMPASTVNVSAVPPLDDDADSTRAESMMPPSAAAPPLIANVISLIHCTRTPASRDASAFDPAAYMYRPAIVRASTTPRMMTTPIIVHAAVVTSRNCVRAKFAYPVTEKLVIRFPPVISAAPPVITNDAASVAISELIRKNVVITPLAAPTAMPMMTPTTIAATGLPEIAIFIAITWHSAYVAPTDRSIPPAIRTIVPAAAMISVADCWSRISRRFVLP
jgi:hypothetical protein